MRLNPAESAPSSYGADSIHARQGHQPTAWIRQAWVLPACRWKPGGCSFKPPLQYVSVSTSYCLFLHSLLSRRKPIPCSGAHLGTPLGPLRAHTSCISWIQSSCSKLSAVVLLRLQETYRKHKTLVWTHRWIGGSTTTTTTITEIQKLNGFKSKGQTAFRKSS